MNRKDRRAAIARTRAGNDALPDINELMAEASRTFRQGQSTKAEGICKQILSIVPEHPPSLNLLGLIKQAAGHHRQAVKLFSEALKLDEQNAASHYNIASSYQSLDRREAAENHFEKCLSLGLSDKNPEEFILENPTIAARVGRTETTNAPLEKIPLSSREITLIANDAFLYCSMKSNLIRGVPLEFFLTDLRSALLSFAAGRASDLSAQDELIERLTCSLAQQCFINEYVFAYSDAEFQQATKVRDTLLQIISASTKIPVLLLAATACYFPLYSLPTQFSSPDSSYPNHAVDLLRQQVREPLEEANDRVAIPALTTIDDTVSVAVMEQYEQNPYPRWTKRQFASSAPTNGDPHYQQDILIAGCGTGKHALDVSDRSPDSRILAIDMSLTSLAYARRKTREESRGNIEYAQADILKLTALGRRFDRIESVGVLHHMADPEAGWSALLSLLKPGGTFRVGLYSTKARRAIAEARAIIREHGFSPNPEGIRALREMIIRNRHERNWNLLLSSADDFYSMSGCRDLFFNVMEHTFTIPQIATLLAKHRSSFLGFEIDVEILEDFKRQHPDEAALTNLEMWDSFEAKNPQTFRHMYVFSVRQNLAA